MAINLAPLPNGIQLVNTGLTPNDRQGDPLPVAFEKINQNFQLVITRNEDNFPGSVTFQQNILVMGSAIFNQTVTLNQTVNANALSRFNGVVEFKNSVTIDGPLIVNNVSVFKNIATFEDDVIFQDPVTFTDIVTMQGAVNLPNGVVRPSNLDVINQPTNDLVLGYNAANGRFAWRQQTGGSGGGGSAPTSVGLAEINAAGAAPDRILRISPSGNSLIWSAIGEGGLANVNLGDINAVAAAPTRVLSVTADGQGLVWVDVAEQQANNFTNIQQIILHQSEGIRTAGRNAALVQNQLGIRVFNYTLPLGVAANIEGEPPAGGETSLAPESPAPLQIVSQHISDAVEGRAYRTTLQVANGKGPYYWVVEGDLPAGLSLAPLTQKGRNDLVGTPPEEGEFFIALTVQDSSTPPMVSSQTIPFNVVPPPPALAVITSDVSEVIAETEVEITIEAVNGTGPYDWSLAAGALPNGLTLDITSTTTTTKISGTPLEHGTFQFTVRIDDSASANATRVLTLVVEPAIIPVMSIVSTGTLNQGVRREPYRSTVLVNGGKPPYSWRVVSGVLPEGLSLSSSYGFENEVDIVGHPTTNGNTSFTLQVLDSSPTPQRQTLECTVSTIIPPTNIQIVTTLLPAAFAGTAYVASIVSLAGEGPYQWSISAGTLPAGLTLQGGNQSGTYITGLAPSPGAYSFTVRVQDESGSFHTRSFAIVTVNPTITLDNSAYSNAYSNNTLNVGYLLGSYRQGFRFRPLQAYYYPGSSNYGRSPYVIGNRNHRLYFYRRSGRIPSGLTFNRSEHTYIDVNKDSEMLTLSGIPLESGVFNFSLYVYRRWQYLWYNNWWYTGSDSTYPNFSLTIAAAIVVGVPTFVTTVLPSVVIGTAWSAVVAVDGGNSVVWGTISGIPSWVVVQRNGKFVRFVGVPPTGLLVSSPYQVYVQAIVDGTPIFRTYALSVTL